MIKGVSLFLVVACQIACQPEEVLSKYVQGRFLSAHNHYRRSHGLSKMEWSWDLAAKAKTNSLKLSSFCYINSDGNDEDVNILQSWGSRGYPPSLVVKKWLKDSIKTKVIRTNFYLGCGSSPCPERWDQAVSFIYVCYYEKE